MHAKNVVHELINVVQNVEKKINGL